jgi:hypothetical protein
VNMHITSFSSHCLSQSQGRLRCDRTKYQKYVSASESGVGAKLCRISHDLLS